MLVRRGQERDVEYFVLFCDRTIEVSVCFPAAQSNERTTKMVYTDPDDTDDTGVHE